MSRIWSWLNTILAWFAGKSAGESAATTAQTEATADAARRIDQAADEAPADSSELIDRLRHGAGL